MEFFFLRRTFGRKHGFENKVEQNKKPNYTKLEWFSENYIYEKKKLGGGAGLSSFLTPLQSLFKLFMTKADG